MLNDIPPKQTLSGSSHEPADPAGVSGFDHLPHPDALPGTHPNALVSVHDLHGDANAFPVLKAFQEHLEQERQQARKRLVTLTAFFVCVLTLVVGGFIAAFVYLFGNMAKREDRLLEAALQQRQTVAAAPAAAPQASAAEQATRQIETVALNLQTNLGSQLATVGAVANKLDSRVEEQNKEMTKLQAALADMQKENDKLRTDLPKLALEAARKLAPPAPPSAPASAATTPPPRSSLSTPAVSVVPTAGTLAASAGKTLKGYDEAVLSIHAHGNEETIPWRVFIPGRSELAP